MLLNYMLFFLYFLIIVFVLLTIIAMIVKPYSVFNNQCEQKNPLAGKRVVFVKDDNGIENENGEKGYLKAIGDTEKHKGFYRNIIKRLLDIFLSFCGLVVLSPIYILLIIAIKIEDPGPAIFVQKRFGKDKQYFKMHKFRSMKMSAPHDVPTHMLENSDQYITKVGRFIRLHSLDELPQIWDIFIGNMSIIGPRPVVYKEILLIAERDKYDANDVKPGLTGWAQINGRNNLGIHEKAKFDGEYVKNLSFKMDLKCFFKSIHVFKEDKSFIEGKHI